MDEMVVVRIHFDHWESARTDVPASSSSAGGSTRALTM